MENLKLPDLPSQQPSTDLLQMLGGNWKWDNGVVYDNDILNAKINKKGVRLQLTPQDQMLIELMMKYSGDYNVNAKMPLLGGNLGVQAGNNGGNKSYGIQWGMQF
jgi:hypothetical protein